MMLSPRKTEQSPAISNSAQSDRMNVNAGYSHMSGAAFDRNEDTGPSIVNKHLTMKGDLESDGDIHVKGKVIGNIRCKLLIVDVEATIEGGVVADEVIVRGKTKGTILANRVKLEKTATVESEIDHNVFSAEEGAKIKGALRFKEEPVGKALKEGLALVA